MDQSTTLFLATTLTELGLGAVVGFFVGHGVRMVASILFKVLAVGLTLLILPILYLDRIGVVQVDFTALMGHLVEGFGFLAQAIADLVPVLTHVLPATGGFALGFAGGLAKK